MTRVSAPGDEVSDADFARFQSLIYREAGIHLAQCKKALLAGRLARRLRELDLTLGEYFRRAASEPAELVRLLDAVSTNETHFFREPAHFELLERRVIPAWRAQAAAGERPRRLRVWSAACSTGQEPYTLAMVLLDALRDDPGWQVEILASDLSTRVLRRAEEATWPLADAGEIPTRYLKRYMLKGTGSRADEMRAGPELREVVRFTRLNLNDAAWPVHGRFDLLFCRNVLIYFDAASKQRVVDRLLDHLAPDGLFFVGHSESLLKVTDRVRGVMPSVYSLTGPRAPDGPRRG